jgi:hypothetical protein
MINLAIRYFGHMIFTGLLTNYDKVTKSDLWRLDIYYIRGSARVGGRTAT